MGLLPIVWCFMKERNNCCVALQIQFSFYSDLDFRSDAGSLLIIYYLFLGAG